MRSARPGSRALASGPGDSAGETVGGERLAKVIRLAQKDLVAYIGDAVAAARTPGPSTPCVRACGGSGVAFDDLGVDAKGGRGSTHQVRRRSLAAWIQDPKWAVSA